jgi:hypothetical protein
MSDDFDTELRDLVSSLVAEAPTYEQHDRLASHTAARRRNPKLAAVLTLMVVLGLVVAAAILIGPRGDEAPASRSATKFCALLQEMKTTAEAPPDVPDPTHGRAGLALLAKRYDQLERIAPTAAMTRWLAEARPVLGHGLVSFTPKVRTAIPSAQKLRRAVQQTCNVDVLADVFKVGFP